MVLWNVLLSLLHYVRSVRGISLLVAIPWVLVSVLLKVSFLCRENMVATLNCIGLSVMLWIQLAWLLSRVISV